MQRRMTELREACGREIDAHRGRAALAADSFRRALLSVRSNSREALAHQDRLSKLKDQLNEVEADLERILTVNACKGAKRTATADSLSTVEVRTEELKEVVKDQNARKNECAAIITQQLHALETLEEKCNQELTDGKTFEEAVLWFNKFLGFRIEGGEGVKFIFNKIDRKNPDKEYSFTVRLNGSVYALLYCDPCLEDLDELIKEMNETNGLFKFIRIMRAKFQAAALNGISRTTSLSGYPDSSTITISSPPPSSVGSASETSDHVRHQTKEQHHDALQRVISRQVETQANPSPKSVSLPRWSPLFQR